MGMMMHTKHQMAIMGFLLTVLAIGMLAAAVDYSLTRLFGDPTATTDFEIDDMEGAGQ